MKKILYLLPLVVSIWIFNSCEYPHYTYSHPNKAAIGASMYGYMSTVLAHQQEVNNMIMYVSHVMDFPDSLRDEVTNIDENVAITFGEDVITAQFSQHHYYSSVRLQIEHHGTSLTDTTQASARWDIKVKTIGGNQLQQWLNNIYTIKVTSLHNAGTNSYEFSIDTLTNNGHYLLEETYHNPNPQNLNQSEALIINSDIPAYKDGDEMVRLKINTLSPVISVARDGRAFYSDGTWEMNAYNSDKQKILTAYFGAQGANSYNYVDYYVTFEYDGDRFEAPQRISDRDNYDSYFF